MSEAAPSIFSAWESFYVIVGSSGAALTGLMFVVVTLIADRPQLGSSNAIDAFGTPTIVHFCVALFVAAVVSAPWSSIVIVDWLLLALGVFGLVYQAIILFRARRQTTYQPVFEDWLWHTILPTFAYLAFLVAGLFLRRDATPSLFAVGGATLLLLFIGIHNAWDTLTYLAFTQRPEPNETKAAADESTPASAPPAAPKQPSTVAS